MEQTQPAVAFDGTNYLVAWKGFALDTKTVGVYASRVSAKGRVLDPAGILITAKGGGEAQPQNPAIAFDGTNYLVVWSDNSSSDGYSDLYGARVSRAGTVLDPGGFPISTAPNFQLYPTVAFDGTNYLVAWDDARSGATHDIYGARVTPAGTVLDPAGIAISTAAGWQESPALAFNGSNYLATWDDWRSGSDSDIYGARVRPDGTVLDTAGIPISTDSDRQLAPSMTFGAGRFLVTWTDWREGCCRVFGTRVGPAGTVLDPAGIELSTAPGGQSSPAPGFDGTNYLVTWYDGRASTRSDVYGARLSAAGVVLDPAGIAISTAPRSQAAPKVAFGGAHYLAVWEDRRATDSNPDIYGARVNPAGGVADPDGLAIAPAPPQVQPPPPPPRR